MIVLLLKVFHSQTPEHFPFPDFTSENKNSEFYTSYNFGTLLPPQISPEKSVFMVRL